MQKIFIFSQCVLNFLLLVWKEIMQQVLKAFTTFHNLYILNKFKSLPGPAAIGCPVLTGGPVVIGCWCFSDISNDETMYIYISKYQPKMLCVLLAIC